MQIEVHPPLLAETFDDILGIPGIFVNPLVTEGIKNVRQTRDPGVYVNFLFGESLGIPTLPPSCIGEARRRTSALVSPWPAFIVRDGTPQRPV